MYNLFLHCSPFFFKKYPFSFSYHFPSIYIYAVDTFGDTHKFVWVNKLKMITFRRQIVTPFLVHKSLRKLPQFLLFFITKPADFSEFLVLLRFIAIKSFHTIKFSLWPFWMNFAIFNIEEVSALKFKAATLIFLPINSFVKEIN